MLSKFAGGLDNDRIPKYWCYTNAGID